jgi:hypothetical protein
MLALVSSEGNCQTGTSLHYSKQVRRRWSGKGKQLELLINPQDVGRLIVFDAWVLNCGRHAPQGQREPNYNNVFLSEETPDSYLRLKAMDHTHAVACQFWAAGNAGASGPGADAAQLGEVADFRVGAPPGAQFVARTYF